MELETVTKIVVLALLLEALVQTVKPIWQPEKRTVEFFVTLGFGLALSVAVNYLAGLDMFAVLGVPLVKAPIVGVLLTGILLSRGSNVVHDIFKAIENVKLQIGDILKKPTS